MSDRIRLVLLSFLMLFVELALIRWSGSNVVYLSYFSNFVLLGSFLGIGLGFLRANARVNLFPWAPVALAGLVLFILSFPVEIDRSGSELIYFGSFVPTGLPVWVTLPIIFLAVAAVMAMIGEGVARVFARFEPLEAYRLDILGSIIGIVAFSLLAFLHAPPMVWGVAAAVLFLVLLGRPNLLQGAALLLMVALLVVESFSPLVSPTVNDEVHEVSWSPYYKVSIDDRSTATEPQWDVKVNGIPHQAIETIRLRQQIEPLYFLPYERLARAPQEVLVVGAGNGTDVAIALAKGAEHVDAVEIDPRLQQLGEQLHPDRPYDDARVSVHIDDGRAFLENSDTKYDLILFALPDSLTLVSGQSALRLESYLFTIEAMREAREHLKPNGAFAMYNYYRERWLIDRLAGTVQTAYGHPPCIDEVGGLALIAASRNPDVLACPQGQLWAGAIDTPPPARDNYPFLYLREPGIPGHYLTTILLILFVSLLLVRGVAGPLRPMLRYADLFFMGAAFLLLETKNVVQFALLFGTTWFVNALVFFGILVSVYAAVEVARHVRFRRPVRLYALLLVALVVAWFVPASALLDLPLGLRFGAAVLVAFTPIFLANLVFAERFQRTASAVEAFGANLLGAMVGGIIEYGALLVGYRALLIVAAVIYGLAFLTGRRHLEPADA